MSLISIVLTLHAEQAVTVPANLGRATHAWFLDQVRQLDRALAEDLHAPNQERPFTVSNLWGVHAASRPSSESSPRPRSLLDEVALAPEQPCYLRVSSIRPELTRVLAERWLPALPEKLNLAGASLRISSAVTTAELHPWASQTTYPELVQAHTLGERPAPGLALRFSSPTVFRSQELFVPLPTPRLVFDSLARRWNSFAPLSIPGEISRFAEETMAISRYKLRTVRVAFGEEGAQGAFPGFMGSVGYSFRNKDRYWMGLIHLLAAFALYAGVGQRVAMGLGQSRKL